MNKSDIKMFFYKFILILSILMNIFQFQSDKVLVESYKNINEESKKQQATIHKLALKLYENSK